MGLGSFLHSVVHTVVTPVESGAQWVGHHWKDIAAAAAGFGVFLGSFAVFTAAFAWAGPFAPLLAAFAAGSSSTWTTVLLRGLLDGRMGEGISTRTTRLVAITGLVSALTFGIGGAVLGSTAGAVSAAEGSTLAGSAGEVAAREVAGNALRGAGYAFVPTVHLETAADVHATGDPGAEAAPPPAPSVGMTGAFDKLDGSRH